MSRQGCEGIMKKWGFDWIKSMRCLDLDFEAHDECLGANGVEKVELFIRLQDGPDSSKSKGRVEVSKDNVTWGTVCDDFWDNDAATVVCKQLGFRWGIAHSLSHFGPGAPGQPIYFDEVVCDGDEKSLLDCNSNSWGTHNCNHQEDASVSCYNVTARLNYALDQKNVGTVEISGSKGWSLVCDEGWDDKDADVLCRELGFVSGFAMTKAEMYMVDESSFTDAYWKFNCTGKESSLANCSKVDYWQGHCNSDSLAAAVCHNKEKDKVNRTVDLRLVDGGEKWGRIEIRYQEVWGHICDHTWTDSSADVACRQLGFKGGIAYGTYNTPSKVAWISYLKCTGKEKRLEECSTGPKAMWEPFFGCTAASVLCYNESAPRVSIKGGGSEGQVEILYDGVTGSICNTYWSKYDARVLCKSQGYVDGEVRSPSLAERHVFLSKMRCDGTEDSIFRCNNSGWDVYETTRCGGYATVMCYKNIRLTGSLNSRTNGIVEILLHNTWYALCGSGFNDVNAQVVCKEIGGFTNGTKLPPGAFGKYYGQTAMPDLICKGNETSVMNCSFDPLKSCSNQHYGYASVSCFNGSLEEDQYSLRNGDYGVVHIKRYGTTGEICEAFWTDNNSDVLCRQLGYAGGKAAFYGRINKNKKNIAPILATSYECNGSETKLSQCLELNPFICYSSLAAGAICYQYSAPRVKLLDGGVNFGRVVIDVDGVESTVCDTTWRQPEANVVCRELGFVSGEKYVAGPGTGDVKLSNVWCTGVESSLLACESSGWGMVTSTSCLNHENDVGVYCFQNVRVVGGVKNSDYMIGRIEIRQERAREQWRTVCADGIHQSSADVICREVKYDRAIIIAPSFFGSLAVSKANRYIADIKCKGNETSIKDCRMTTERNGTCSIAHYNYASVLCVKNTTNEQSFTVKLTSGYHGAVIINQYNQDGTICVDGWDEREANVTCRQFGYLGGVVLGPQEVFTRRKPVWFSEFNCTGNEKKLQDCPKTTRVSLQCVRSIKDAGVLCYNSTGVKVRLAGPKDYYGTVEVIKDGQVGTVCDYDWTKNDARVLCRQLNFPDGRPYKRSYYGAGKGSVVLSGFFCDGKEDRLLDCPSRGWYNVQDYCKIHQNDASVYCYRKVNKYPENKDYGAVRVWMDDVGSYSLVCADGFTDTEAKTACMDMGYVYGKSVCCSAFGDIDGKIWKTDVTCQPGDQHLESCSSTDGVNRCPSQQYASVVCSSGEPPIGYKVELEKGHYGRVKMTYFNQTGYVCSEGFDAADANVICKQIGYLGGFAYQEHNRNYWTSSLTELRWLRNLTCTGDEDRLDECDNLDKKWGQIQNCSIKSFAAAFCFTESEKQGPQIRVVGNKSEGVVEVFVNGTWGSICQRTITNKAADVICRQLNYTYGTHSSIAGVPPSKGPVLIDQMYCTGEEKSIYDCRISINTDPLSPCHHHQYDLVIKCYSNVRLVDTDITNYGKLQVHNETGWYAVCDTNFDDVDARVACRSLGYEDGRAQLGSALGTWITSSNNVIGVTDVNCKGNETMFRYCNMGHGKCQSGHYVTLACTQKAIDQYKIDVEIPMTILYGDVEVKLYDVRGSICDDTWNDAAARVVCREKGFVSGNATRGSARRNFPTLVSGVNCTGNERALRECKMKPFNETNTCQGRSSRAAVICSKKQEGVRFRIGNEYQGSGRAEVYLNGQWGTICNIYWEDVDAGAFCRQLPDYVGGFEASPAVYGDPAQPIWMTRVECRGKEMNFLDCEASWDPMKTSRCSHNNDAGVMCFKSVRLMRGNYRNNGIVEVYVNGQWGTICSSGFGEKEADVACRILGYERGTPLCCSPYGFSFKNPIIHSFRCNGDERHLTDCESTAAIGSNTCFSQDYASVACYNESTLSKGYSISLPTDSPYTGQVNLTYLGIEGRICNDGWTDLDAGVACRELGYPKGFAYTHYKSEVDSTGPYWSSNFNCTGNESSLKRCKHIGFGNVTECKSKHYAGVLCVEDNGISYRMEGGDFRYGRVEVLMQGKWGTICDRYWDQRDAEVFCRMFGFSTGDAYYDSYKDQGTGKVWGTMFHCKGDEDNLNSCPHEGWKITDSIYCRTHKDDAGVQCYTNVKLSNGILNRNSRTGAVMLYQNQSWLRVCDTGFNDNAARVVCRELGYKDGRAICCSAYGSVSQKYIQMNYTLRCNGRERNVNECLQKEECKTASYASVVCFGTKDEIKDDEYSFSVRTGGNGNKGQVVVSHYGVDGRICSRDWDDADAHVMCRSLSYTNGMAYYHDELSTISSLRGPYWLSGFNCTGDESSLLECPNNTRLNLGNCSGSHIASVLCFNDTGDSAIKYYIAGGVHYGRVEVSIEKQRGTICDASWDNKDASVLCREKGFSEGVAVPGAAYGQGTGPIWQSHIQCVGNEPGLRWCPHRGFVDRYSDASWLLPLICDSHRDDASVFCFKNVKLNEGHDSPMGGVEVYNKEQKTWFGICDTGFSNAAAKVVCRSLGLDYTDGRAINGSAYGNISGEVLYTNVKCSGQETDFTQCIYDFNKTKCESGMYASVMCSNKTIVDTGFDVRLAPDSLSSTLHGIVEIRVNGVWGRVCMNHWDDRDANVTCKKLGYAGGVAYLHIMKNRKPIMMNQVHCKGNETNLMDCDHSLKPDLKNCAFHSNDAGILCYQSKGIQYNLVGGESNSTGRVELSYDGVVGTVCAWSWKTADAKVLCRQLGYSDGIVSYNHNSRLVPTKRWVTGYFCQGDEKTLMTCLNTGFNSTFLDDLCLFNEPGAYASCYNDVIEPKKIRLVNGNSNYTGRLEVFIQGPNQWGTICDDFWDETAAKVVCRQMGLTGGKPIKEAHFGRGSGPIWFDNVKCFGNETHIWDCSNRGIGTHNCNHTEDVGVKCEGPIIPTTSTTTISTTISTTTVPITTSKTKTTTTTTTTEPTTLKSTTIKPTTLKPTTLKPTTLKPTTTVKPTTKTTTTLKPTPKPTTKRPTTSTQKTTTIELTSPTKGESGINATLVPPKQQQESSTSLGVIIAVPVVIFFVILAVIILVFVFKVRKFHKRDTIPHERFHDDIIEHNSDGSIAVSNQLYDMTMQPTGTANGSAGDNLQLTKNGSAYYSKPLTNGRNETKNSFANPLYGQQNASTVIDSNEALPDQDEIRFPIDDSVSKA
ncbi:deleted in malignant brain tumors 1 protein-like [Saccostrea echinata]|uniref:deleted in malignant brain tumors 1 protein-like n=1 Tax=Saccostrea echinata TaxID=191078 RepID=UPI002A835642|nr:deleted in malignant brain tumors 1 protein-like [Saccostrea echinata]